MPLEKIKVIRYYGRLTGGNCVDALFWYHPGPIWTEGPRCLTVLLRNSVPRRSGTPVSNYSH
jgi:hypothetical protein